MDGGGGSTANRIRTVNLTVERWFKIINQHVELRLLVKPHAKRSALLAILKQELQVSLHAKPCQGEANRELISYLSKLLRVPKSQIFLRRGEASRHKVVVLPLTDAVQLWLKNYSGN